MGGPRRASRRNLRTRTPVLVAALVAALAGLAAFLPRAGTFLVAEDPFTHADVALVLSGLPTSRAFAARDPYRQGRVDEIWILPEPPNTVEGEVVGSQVAEELVRLKLFNPVSPQWAARVLASSGGPVSKLIVLLRSADGTIREAPQARELVRVRRPKSLVVVTSKSASRRARMIFRHTFKKDGVAVFSYPTPYDSFEVGRWWTKPRNALTVVTEYEKLLVNALTLALRLDG